MRLILINLLVAFFAAMASAHTINCWGKALNPTKKDLETAVNYLNKQIAISEENGPGDGRDKIPVHGHSCTYLVCDTKMEMSIRVCSDQTLARQHPLQNIVDGIYVLLENCVYEYKGKTVSGGMLDHPDHWSIVVQQEETCDHVPIFQF